MRMEYKEIRKPEFDKVVKEEIEHCMGYMQKQTRDAAVLVSCEIDYSECGDVLLVPMCKYIIKSGEHIAIGQVSRFWGDDDIKSSRIYLTDEMENKLKEIL
jgi:hypothetical protein